MNTWRTSQLVPSVSEAPPLNVLPTKCMLGREWTQKETEIMCACLCVVIIRPLPALFNKTNRICHLLIKRLFYGICTLLLAAIWDTWQSHSLAQLDLHSYTHTHTYTHSTSSIYSLSTSLLIFRHRIFYLLLSVLKWTVVKKIKLFEMFYPQN